MLPALRSSAQPKEASEPQLKVAFLYNFTQLVTWPTNAFASSNSPLVIGLLGKTPLKEELTRLNGLKAAGRFIQTTNLNNVADATNCHLLFISETERLRYDTIFDALNRAPVLTVGESRGFSTRGMIELVRSDDSFNLRINLEAANAAGLRLSSRLTRLDRRLHPAPPHSTNTPSTASPRLIP